MNNSEDSERVYLYFSVVVETVLFVFVTALIGVSIFKYKNYGFTLKLLIVLDFGLACLVVFQFLNFVLYLNLGDQTQSSKTIYVSCITGSYFVSSVSLSAILWVYALKYWSIATKIELAIREVDINSENKLIGFLMFGGLAIIVVAIGFSSIVVYRYFDPESAFQWSYYDLAVYVLLGFIALECFLLIDALRKFSRTQVENKTISSKMVYALCCVYSMQLIGNTLMELVHLFP